ncbi:MAG TPA: hypothetical protein VFZ89_18540 [Solirubrobacteraceae bacterium]
MHIKKLVPVALSVAVATTAIAPAVSGAKATDTGRHDVTVAKLSVYKQPTKGYVGLLVKGESFVVKKLSKSGKYAYGNALGHANKTGWVLASALDRR